MFVSLPTQFKFPTSSLHCGFSSFWIFLSPVLTAFWCFNKWRTVWTFCRSASRIRLLHFFVIPAPFKQNFMQRLLLPHFIPLIPIYSMHLSTAPVLSLLLLQYLPCFRLFLSFPFLKNRECNISSLHISNASISQSRNALNSSRMAADWTISRQRCTNCSRKRTTSSDVELKCN